MLHALLHRTGRRDAHQRKEVVISAMQYRENFLTRNDCYRAGRALGRPKGIVVHSTGTDQKRIRVYADAWDRPGVRTCVHGFLGLDESGALSFEQHLPFTMRCWGCGSGTRGSYNNSHLQFEICETLADGAWCRETYAAALEVCEKLCRSFGIPAEAVVCHSEAYARGYGSNHGDVMHWWPRHGLSMDGFRAELSKRLEEDAMVRYKTIDEVPASLRPETAQLIAAGVLQGKGPEQGLDVTEDMLRTMIISKRYIDKIAGGTENA